MCTQTRPHPSTPTLDWVPDTSSFLLCFQDPPGCESSEVSGRYEEGIIAVDDKPKSNNKGTPLYPSEKGVYKG